MTQTDRTTSANDRTRPDEPAPAPGSERESERAPEPEATTDGGHLCNVAFCPIGLALTAAERVQPEVVSHLLLAGREFFLAAKAVMDARAEDLDRDSESGGPARMERIDIG